MLEEFIEYLDRHFKESDFSPEESRVSSEIHLRFELGEPFENGTKERVDQSVFRASSIFSDLFSDQDEVWILIKSFAYAEGIKEFIPSSKGYLKRQIEGLDSLLISKREKTIEEFEEALNEEGEMELTDFTTTHIQEVVHQRVKKVCIGNILRGIANLEMGFEPAVGEIVYFVNRESNVVFHMYDDRGCIVYSSNKSILRPLYKKYNAWLVEYYRYTFDQLFDENA